MLLREICRILGRYLSYFSLILCIPLLVAILYEFFLEPASHPQPHSTLAFLKTLSVCLLLALLFQYFGKKSRYELHRRESILLVSFIWLLTAGISSLPFLFSKTLQNPIDAYFEAMSGLTTTGSTIFYPKAYDPMTKEEIPITLTSAKDPSISYTFFGTITPALDHEGNAIICSGVEAIGKALLFWRAFLQWLGGMGIVVLFLVVLPALSMGGRFLFETEMPGPNKESIKPRVKETASILWKIYLSLTLIQIILLKTTNSQMSLFEAITLSLSTISTGGFSVHSCSFDGYQNIHTQWIVILFMIIGSINFTLYFHCIRGKIYRIYEPEFFAYLGTLVCSCLILSFILWNTPKHPEDPHTLFSFAEALRYGSFQAISAQTSTGFAISDYDAWPLSSQVLLLILTFVGGMSGSTSGGIKIARHYIMYRSCIHKIESIFRPTTIRCLKIGKKEIPDKSIITVFIFFCILITLTTLGTFLLVLDGVDPDTSLGLIACFINNAGLSFGIAGPSGSCAFLSNFGKILSILWMVLGRLEFFAVLVLFVPAFWKGK